MKLPRSFAVGLVLVVLLVTGIACNLTGGDGNGQEARRRTPTLAAGLSTPVGTPTGTRTFPASPTPFPTRQTIPTVQPFPWVPTPTPLRLNPTPVVLPSQIPFAYDITYPVDGSQIAGYFTIIGSASHPRMMFYVVEFGPHPNPGNLWYPFSGQRTTPVFNGPLAAWNTTTVPDGSYQIRLHIYLNDGTSLTDTVADIRVSNVRPTVAPTNTPTPRPNQPPRINAVPGQQVNAGSSIRVPITTSDPNGDQVNLFVSVDNTSIATASVSGPSEVTINGLTKGTATVTVTASDNHGGTAATAFTVTVQGQNQAPSVAPIANQTIKQGETLDLPVTISDPDGDALSLRVSSDNEGIVNAFAQNNNSLRLVGVAPGTANITVKADDGKGGTANTVFQVVVGQPNRPPTLDKIGPQSMRAGESLDVPYNASDPDGDTLTALATSSDTNIVTATIPQPGVIHLEAKSGGSVRIVLSVGDGKNPPVEEGFQVEVSSPNQPPAVEAIGDQQLNAGETRDVPYNASDPDGDTLTATASSSDENVVSASVNTPGVITLTANGGGTAVVTLYVEDGTNPAASVSFNVQVNVPNNNPALEQIGPQTVAVNNMLTLTVNASDPDGDPLTVSAVSDNPSVATASASGMDVLITGVAPGSANVTVDVLDDKGGMASTIFTVTVEGVNNPPVIGAIGDQSLTMGEEISVPVIVSDPDGDPVVLTAISQNGGVVNAAAVDNNAVILTAVGEGSAVVELTADDAKGGIATLTFNVNVTAAAPAFDLMNYPVLPELDQQEIATLMQVYQSGVDNFGNQGRAFSKVGDESVENPAFLTPFAQPGNYDLGGRDLQTLIDRISGTQVRDDPTINSFNVDSVAAGSGYDITTLSQPAPAEPPCNGSGTLLSCEFQATRPAFALVSFSAPNVTFMDPAVFRNELQTLVSNSLSSGVIPILTTIPAGGGFSTEQLVPYNQAIVEVATASGVPLWNVWRLMQENGIGDPNSVAPEGAGNLTDPALAYGVNLRNLSALQLFRSLRQTLNIS